MKNKTDYQRIEESMTLVAIREIVEEVPCKLMQADLVEAVRELKRYKERLEWLDSKDSVDACQTLLDWMNGEIPIDGLCQTIDDRMEAEKDRRGSE